MLFHAGRTIHEKNLACRHCSYLSTTGLAALSSFSFSLAWACYDIYVMLEENRSVGFVS